MSQRTENINAPNGARPVAMDTEANSRLVNPAGDHEPPVAQFGRAVPPKCFVCHDPIVEGCFCQIHREDGGPITLCSPKCSIQYFGSTGAPADTREQELGAPQDGVHFLIGEDEP